MNSFTLRRTVLASVRVAIGDVGSVSATEVHSNTRGDCLGSVPLGMLQAITAQLSYIKRVLR